MKIINYNFFFNNCLIVLIFLLSGCQLQNSSFKKRPAVYNLIEKVIEQKDKDSLLKREVESENIIDKTPAKIPKKLKSLSTQTDSKKEKKLILSLNSFLKKTNISIILNFGEPNLIINHGNTLNYQYHLVNCFVDLFFIKQGDKILLNHYELRPTKINSEFKKILCKKEIYKIINKK